MKHILGVVIAAVALTGCASQLYVGRTVPGHETIYSVCEPYTELEPMAVECREMRPVVVTNNPADEMFWVFERRVMKRGSYNIPVGHTFFAYAVVGTQERCEAVRAAVVPSTKPNVVTTKPCVGPFYLRRA